MSASTRFWRNETGSLVEKVALSSAVLALASVLGANLLSTKLQKGELPVIALIHNDSRSGAAGIASGVARAGVDMSATASIPATAQRPAPASPCQTNAK